LAPPNYNTFILQQATSLPQLPYWNHFLVAPYGEVYNWANLPDLWVINSGDPIAKPRNFHLQILDGESNFQNVIVDRDVPLFASSGIKWQYSIGVHTYIPCPPTPCTPSHVTSDLFFFKVWDYSQPGPQYLSIYEYDAANGTIGNPFQSNFLIYGPDEVQCSAPIMYGNYLGQVWSDVLVVRKNGSSTHKTEAHLLTRRDGFQNAYLELVTPLEETYDNFDIRGGTWEALIDDTTNSDNSKKMMEPENQVTQFSTSNYPNPFNPSTLIRYSIPQNTFVKIRVFNTLGQEIMELVNDYKAMGNYEVSFDGSNLSSGIYFYRIEAGNYVEMKKLVLIK
jgi:hypothetical protein